MNKESILILILLLIGIIIFIWNQSFLKCITGETCSFFKNNDSKNIKEIIKFYIKSLCWRNSLLTAIIIVTILIITGLITINYKIFILILFIIFTVNYFYCNYWDYHYYKPGFEKIQEITN